MKQTNMDFTPHPVSGTNKRKIERIILYIIGAGILLLIIVNVVAGGFSPSTSGPSVHSLRQRQAELDVLEQETKTTYLVLEQEREQIEKDLKSKESEIVANSTQAEEYRNEKESIDLQIQALIQPTAAAQVVKN